MAFEPYEISVEQGRPVELFLFTWGSATYRYTSAEDEVVFGGYTWYPRAITRSAPSQNSSERRHTLELSLPSDDEVCAPFVGIVPAEKLELTITKFHRGDTEPHILWEGVIAGVSYKKEGAICSLSGMTTEAALGRMLPRYTYQGLCNHRLFGPRCTVSSAAHKFTGVATGVSGRAITVAGVTAALGADGALGGYVDFGSADWRLVAGQSGDVLTLLLAFREDVSGQSVDVYAGCDHTAATCGTRFSNTGNFGGYPYVPTSNPFKIGLQ